MHIEVLLFGPVKDLAGEERLVLDLPDGTTIDGVAAALAGRCPRLASALPGVRFAVNAVFASRATVLHVGDEVAVIPPVSGG